MVMLGLKSKKPQFGVFPIEGFCQNRVLEWNFIWSVLLKADSKLWCLNCGFGLGSFEVLDSGGCCIL